MVTNVISEVTSLVGIAAINGNNQLSVSNQTNMSWLG